MLNGEQEELPRMISQNRDKTTQQIITELQGMKGVDFERDQEAKLKRLALVAVHAEREGFEKSEELLDWLENAFWSKP